MRNYTDADLTFYMQVYKDAPLAQWCLSNLRRYFSSANVIVISDGDDTISNNDFSRFNVDFRNGNELFWIECGGQMHERTFNVFLEKPTKWLFKIDSDTGIHRAFLELPEDYGIFGTIQENAAGLRSLQGGCYGMTREVVETIIKSGILKDKVLTDYRNTYALTEITRVNCERSGKLAEDWMLGWIATQLEIPMYHYGEILSKWKEYVPNNEDWFTITHPCKDGKL